MMIGIIKRLANITVRHRCTFSKGQQYTAVSSQFQIFRNHMMNIQDGQSLRQAAELLAKLETNQHLLGESLTQLQKEIDNHSNQHPLVFELHKRGLQMEIEINRQIIQNQQIETRAKRQIESGKVYGISKIAKEVIETVDYLRSAINAQELASKSKEGTQELASLKALQKEFIQLLKKYQIEQFTPIDQIFDPNEQESIGQIQANDPSQRNLVAEVKRTGFKIGQRLLRSACVVIYI